VDVRFAHHPADHALRTLVRRSQSATQQPNRHRLAIAAWLGHGDVESANPIDVDCRARHRAGGRVAGGNEPVPAGRRHESGCFGWRHLGRRHCGRRWAAAVAAAVATPIAAAVATVTVTAGRDTDHR
jgi:hypothetical protein